jgi:hypothetical protein
MEHTQLFDKKDFYIPPEETLISEIGRPSRGHFNLIHLTSGFKADIYLSGMDTLHRLHGDWRYCQQHLRSSTTDI